MSVRLRGRVAPAGPHTWAAAAERREHLCERLHALAAD